jgi:hypothetical protein
MLATALTLMLAATDTLVAPPLVPAPRSALVAPAADAPPLVPATYSAPEVTRRSRGSPATETDTHAVYPMVILGPIVAVASWVGSAVALFGSISCSGSILGDRFSCQSMSGWLLIPMAGPWLALGDSGNHGHEGVAVALGLGQALGIGAMIAGLSIRLPVEDADVEVTPNGVAGTF